MVIRIKRIEKDDVYDDKYYGKYILLQELFRNVVDVEYIGILMSDGYFKVIYYKDSKCSGWEKDDFEFKLELRDRLFLIDEIELAGLLI